MVLRDGGAGASRAPWDKKDREESRSLFLSKNQMNEIEPLGAESGTSLGPRTPTRPLGPLVKLSSVNP